MRNVIKKELTLLLMFTMLVIVGGASAAGATAFRADPGGATCAGNITIQADGSVKCATGGELQSRCTGTIIIDSKGVVRCKTAAQRTCTLTIGTKVAGTTELLAECSPAATVYEWSDTRCSSSRATCGVTPATDTTYTVTGKDAGGNLIGSASVMVIGTSAQPGSKPSCNLIASLPSISAGGSVTLTASCSPAADSYAWTGGTCAGSSQICIASPTSNTTYTVTGHNSNGDGNLASATVTVTTASGPPVCTLTQSMTAGKIALTADCMPAATSYNWSANAGLTNTQKGGFIDPQPTKTTTYTVQGANAAGSGNTDSLTITIAAPTPNCTLDADPGVVDMGGKSTLTANCSPAATSYAWTGCTAETANTNTCTVTLAAAGDTIYTVIGSNDAGAGNSASATVTVAKPSCTLEAKPPQIAPGGSSTLEAICSPSVGTTYAWAGGVCTGKTTNTCDTGALVSSTPYSVTGSNSLGSSTANATVTVAKPDCTLTAAPALIGRGGTSTLTASCSTAADSYTWTGGTCAGKTTSICTETLAAAGATIYTVTGTNLAGVGNTASVTVTAAAPNCKLTATPSTVSPNSASTLTASCTPAADSYAWTGGTCAGKATSTCTVTPDATTAYSVTGSDLVGAGNTASATVSVLADPGCPNGYSYSIRPITWPAQRGQKGPLITMNHCEVIAFQYIMPDHEPMRSQTLYATVPKYLTLSQTAFDFSPELETSGCAGAGQNDPIIWNETTAGIYPYGCQTTATATYYLNVRNADSREGPDNCPAGGACTFYLSW